LRYLPMLWATMTARFGSSGLQIQGGSVLAGRGTVVDHGRTDRGRRQSHRARGCPNSE
jgi:hypothetical protein